MMKPNTFMVVDDNHTSNMICEFAIRRYSETARIILFTEPEAALENIEKEYDSIKGGEKTILFLDINMPSMTGWEFLEEFEKFRVEVVQQFIIYILTSSVDDRDKEKAKASPLVTGFISKPLMVQSVQYIFDQL